MSYEITEADVKAMSDEQRVALMESLLTAVLADGRAEPPEVTKFDETVDRIPWGIDRTQLKTQMEAARKRVLDAAKQGESAVLSFIHSIAKRITDPAQREKVLHAMCAIMATSDLNTGEKNVAFAFATAFNVPLDRLDAIKNDIKGRIRIS